MPEPSKIQISFSENNVGASTRQTVEQSIAVLAARSAEARARLRGAEPELEKLSDSEMSQPSQWQVAGSAPEVYERELVPALFGE